MKRKRKLSGIIMTIILIFTLNGWSTVTVFEKEGSSKLVSSIPLKSSQILSVSFIDVGQGDAIFVELPNNQTMLIEVYRTDQDGTIIISSDGSNITVKKVKRRSYYRAA